MHSIVDHVITVIIQIMIYYQNEMKLILFHAVILHCKTIIGWGQPGLMR